MLVIRRISAEFTHELHSGSCCSHCTCPIQGLLQYFTQLLLKIECRSSHQSRDQSPALPSPQKALCAPLWSGYAPSSSFPILHLEILIFLNIFPQPGGCWGIVFRLAAGRWGSEPRPQASFDNKEKTNSHFTSLRVQKKLCALCCYERWLRTNFRRRFEYALCPWRMRCFIILSEQFFWLLGSTKSSVLHHVTFRYVSRWLSNKHSLMLQNCISTPKCISKSSPLSILNFMSSNNLFLPGKLHP